MNEALQTEALHPEDAFYWRTRGDATQQAAASEQGIRGAVQIFAFGRFSVMKSGTPLVFSRKAPKRPITLLKALIALGGREVSGHRLTDALWPNEEGDAAHDVLAVNLHRLRRLLGDPDSVTLHDGHVSLDPRCCWVDVWGFQRLLGQAPSTPEVERPALLQRALALYRGTFLACDQDEPWTLSVRERLRSMFVRHSAELGALREDAGLWEEAIEGYQRAIETDELAEEFYQGLMRCYGHLGRRAEGISVYRRLRRTLSVILGTAACPATEALLQELLSQRLPAVSGYPEFSDL